MLRVGTAEVNHAAVLVFAEKLVIQIRNKFAVHILPQKLGRASAKLTVSGRLGPRPGEHSLELLLRDMVNIPSVQPPNQRIDDVQVVTDGILVFAHGDECL